MARLSDLIKMQHIIQGIIAQDPLHQINQITSNLEHQINDNLQRLEIDAPTINAHPVMASATIAMSEIDGVLAQIKTQIDDLSKHYFQESYHRYDSTIIEDPESVLNKTLTMSDETRETLRGRIIPNNDWKWPGLILRPAREEWIQHMVACDPLYLVDRDWNFLSPARERFNQAYQQRLRLYRAFETDGRRFLDHLPQGQFGLILSFNFFNHKPLDIMRIYLEDCYNLLRPGGRLIFTFNDCDYPGAVILCENHSASFQPGSIIREMAKTAGYEISFEFRDHGAIYWMEVTKPGTLDSIRGGQSIAKIVDNT